MKEETIEKELKLPASLSEPTTLPAVEEKPPEETPQPEKSEEVPDRPEGNRDWSHISPEERASMPERFQNMSPAQREQMRQRWSQGRS